jgi:hypothetical protein
VLQFEGENAVLDAIRQALPHLVITAVPVAAPEAPEAEQDPIDELRSWAKTMDLDRLAKHVEAAGFSKKAGDPVVKIQAFLDGKSGSYHLRQSLETVRADLAGYA